MYEVMIHKGKDLSPDQKQTLETLLGRAISDQEDVSIRVLQPLPEISPDRRRQILEQLRSYFQRIDAQRKPVSAEEADEIINEALRSSRPGYRPVN